MMPVFTIHFVLILPDFTALYFPISLVFSLSLAMGSAFSEHSVVLISSSLLIKPIWSQPYSARTNILPAFHSFSWFGIIFLLMHLCLWLSDLHILSISKLTSVAQLFCGNDFLNTGQAAQKKPPAYYR